MNVDIEVVKVMKDYRFSYKLKEYSIPTAPKETMVEKGRLRINTRKSKMVLFDVGQDQLTHKAYYLNKQFKKTGLSTVYFATDRYGIGIENEIKEKIDVVRLTYNSFVDWKNYIKKIKTEKPMHIEFYLGLRTWDLFFYVLYAKVKRIPIFVKCRGGEILNWKTHSLHRKIANMFALRSANLISLRELYMPKYFIDYNIAKLDHVVFVHNAVPVPDKKTVKFSNRILYLNSLKKFRNPLRLIEIAEELKKRDIDFNMDVVGFTEGNLKAYETDKLELEFKKRIKEKKLDDIIKCYTFTNDTHTFFEQSSIFILPTDLVYCNNALLEAMSYECVPIVNGGDGAELIIDDNISGFITSESIIAMADKIEYLIKNPEQRIRMGMNSKEKIIKEYNVENQEKVMLGFYEQFLWRHKK